MHWIEAEDARGPIWELYIDFSHWGLIYVGTRIRWLSLGVPVLREPIINMTGIT